MGKRGRKPKNTKAEPPSQSETDRIMFTDVNVAVANNIPELRTTRGRVVKRRQIIVDIADSEDDDIENVEFKPKRGKRKEEKEDYEPIVVPSEEEDAPDEDAEMDEAEQQEVQENGEKEDDEEDEEDEVEEQSAEEEGEEEVAEKVSKEGRKRGRPKKGEIVVKKAYVKKGKRTVRTVATGNINKERVPMFTDWMPLFDGFSVLGYTV